MRKRRAVRRSPSALFVMGLSLSVIGCVDTHIASPPVGWSPASSPNTPAENAAEVGEGRAREVLAAKVAGKRLQGNLNMRVIEAGQAALKQRAVKNTPSPTLPRVRAPKHLISSATALQAISKQIAGSAPLQPPVSAAATAAGPKGVVPPAEPRAPSPPAAQAPSTPSPSISTGAASGSAEPHVGPTLTAKPADEPVDRPEIERLPGGLLRIGGYLVDRRKGQVRAPAKINMTEGILEYYAVASDGKLHESLLEFKGEPSHLHLALILAGFKASVYGPYDEEKMERPLLEPGSDLALHVEWTPPGFPRRQRLPAASWLYQRDIKQASKPLRYRFRGSVFHQQRYVADLGRSIVSLIIDESAVVELIGDQGNPYQGDALGYEAYQAALPPKGSAVELVFSRAQGVAPVPAEKAAEAVPQGSP
ncbi:MAG: YdjY domain-containing protein [Myxococcota bacterium]|nr:YdjY domain-containing protein [Myxococcota bacterium]